MARWGGLRERLGRRGIAAVALLLAAGLVAVPLSLRGGGPPKPCVHTACVPWAELPRPVRALTPLEAATWGGYVALGDSYSAGEGAYAIPADTANANRCHRTSLAYFHLVAQAFTFAKGTGFWACSGATTYDVLHGERGEPPQVDRLSAGTSLVTISIGGNDSGFSHVLAGCVVRLPFTAGCQGQGDDVAKRLGLLRGGLKSVLDTIVQRAPNARIIVLGYPRLFSEGSGSDSIGVADQRWLNGWGRALDGLIREIAGEEDEHIVASQGRGTMEFVDAYGAFAGHEVGSGDPFVNGLDMNLMSMSVGASSYHPTAGGYRELAALIGRQVVQGPGREIRQFQ